MVARSLRALADATLLSELRRHVRSERECTAVVLAYIAEAGERRLYARAGYESLHHWCVGELGYSSDSAYKRSRAARALRAFPVLHAALVEGRLNLSGIVLLQPHLTAANVEGLLAEVAGRSNDAIELLLARRFPKPDTNDVLRQREAPHWPETSAARLAVRPIGGDVSHDAATGSPSAATNAARDPSGSGAMFEAAANETATVAPDAPAAPAAKAPWPRVTPLSPGRFELRTTLDQQTYDLLRRAQDLLASRVKPSDLNALLGKVLELAMPQIEKLAYGATDQPGQRRASGDDGIPAEVRRAVWERDGGQCTYAANGRRCACRQRLELDHVLPKARGGRSTVENLRLRCRAHNRLEADDAFGAGYMQGRIAASQEAGAAKRAAGEHTSLAVRPNANAGARLPVCPEGAG